MTPNDTGVDQAQLEAFAKAHLTQHKKLTRERDRVRALTAQTDRRLREAQQAGRADEEAFFSAYARLLQSYARQFELLSPSLEVVTVPDPATLVAIETQALISQALALQVELLNLNQLYRLLDADLAAATAGEPAAVDGPAAWQAIRGRVASERVWLDALKQFHYGFPAVQQSVLAVGELMANVAKLPAGPATLARAKEVNVPVVRGELYRLEAFLRRFPEGQALLEGTRIARLEALQETPAQQAPVARKRSLTDKIKDVFNKP